MLVTSLQSGKIVHLSKFRAFADDSLNAILILEFVLRGVKNNVGIVGNAGYLHYLLFPQCFQKASFVCKWV